MTGPGISGTRTFLVVCDFDDSAAECNVAQLLLAEFAGPAATAVQRAYRDGKLAFRDYQEKMFNTVAAPVEDLMAYAREHVTLRPGLHDAITATRERGGAFVIASAGMDFYVKPVLAANGLGDVPVLSVTGAPATAGGATMTFRYDYPAGQERCRDWAVCKCDPIEKARSRDEHVIFIGDGLRSDACAAEKADTVFARSRLLEHCKDNGIEAIEFDDFHPIARHISGLDLGRKGPGDRVTNAESMPETMKAIE